MPNDLIKSSNNVDAIDPYSSQEIAISLRKYLISGNKKEEEQLVSQLNNNPGILQRLFPTKGQRDLQRMDSAKLAKIRANDTEIMDLHNTLYVESIKIQTYQIVEIEKERSRSVVTVHKLKFLEELSRMADVKVKEIIHTITASQKEMQKKFRDDMREHKVEFSDPDDAEFLEASIKQTRFAMGVHMEITEKMLQDTVSAIKTKAAQLTVELKS